MNNANKEITLIGEGHTVNGTQLFSIADGKLNLQGGTFTGNTGAGVLYVGSQTSGHSSSAVVNISHNTTLKVTGGAVAGAVSVWGGQLNISGGAIQNESPINPTGLVVGGGTVDISGGEISGISVVGGTVNISDGEISISSGSTPALHCAGGETTVRGNATIKNTSSNGGTGISLIIGNNSNNNTPTWPTVTIDGGTIEAKSYGIYAPVGNLTIDSGIIRGTGNTPGIGIHAGSFYTYEDPENPKFQNFARVTINGGSVSGNTTGLFHDGYLTTALTLNGGTFSAADGAASIKIDPSPLNYNGIPSARNLAELLGTDKAYFRDSGRIPDSELTNKNLTGTIIVKDSTSEEPAPPAHQHTWSEAWSSDANGHWHRCTVQGCPITDYSACEEANAAYAAHIYDNDADAACNTCGYTRTVSGGNTTPVTPPVIDNPVYYPPSAPTGGTSSTTPTTNTATSTEPQAPVTTTTTDSSGTVTETTTNPDGSSVAVVTQPDGATATITTSTYGQVNVSVSLPAAAVSAAQSSGEAVTLPIPAVSAARNTASAPAVTVSTGSSRPVKVEIPTTTTTTPGTVAVLVKADGTEEVIRTSVATADGVAAPLSNGDTVKIVDNSKDFADVSTTHWAGDAVDFVTARELFSGTSETAFTPDAPMTRAMLVTVLARLDGADTSGGETWYEKGVEWAVAHDISDGSDPNGNITREQLAVMLWRYAGSPAAAGSLDGFADADAVNGYAQEAMRWAVENGVINGLGGGQLAPQGQATRAQVAQMLKNFMESK